MYHYRGCGLSEVWLKNGYTLRTTKYGEAVSIRDVEGLHNTIGLHIIGHSAVLAAEEVRFLRKELDMSQVTLGNILGVSESTIRNWEAGRGPIDPSADRLLRSLYSEHVTGDGHVRELIERISQLNRDIHAARLELEECGSGWCEAA